jgi:hypothetical protein
VTGRAVVLLGVMGAGIISAGGFLLVIGVHMSVSLVVLTLSGWGGRIEFFDPYAYSGNK